MSLELNNITLAVPGRTLLHQFSLTVPPGETVSLMGPSGCGKSILLSYISGAHHPHVTGAGRVLINGEDVTDKPMEKRRVGLQFQDDLLFPHMTVNGNLAFALHPGLSAKERQWRIDDALSAADLSGYGNMRPENLSGGQRARISLMRTLLAEPAALLLDEPFSRLDAHLRQQIRTFVFDTVREKHIPALLVTHDEQDCNGRVIELVKEGVAHD
ncbi:ATP-binding cassette domain-containing protein [Sansalvadorimonas verongulae]|uniref:ATP-binding cassette domain-containing protein n=1 Tax=Sansalvadorimonas verongulae TaxID=2172824 RepID=UPI0012BB5EDF|nr:ATP-binding cassette domain-containing protein [Sansalvadorimonas verongulae]MTI14569.1 ATP-binding cassette domain-containing protein [Sansalvadorimonas verongulae]